MHGVSDGDCARNLVGAAGDEKIPICVRRGKGRAIVGCAVALGAVVLDVKGFSKTRGERTSGRRAGGGNADSFNGLLNRREKESLHGQD